MALVKETYLATQRFPKEEIYGLISQLRRAIVSVPSNIAEGQGRTTDREFRHFLAQARGSLMEAETQVLIAQDLDYLEKHVTSDLLSKMAEVGRMINGLMSSLVDETKPED